jgi:hypothetical protein
MYNVKTISADGFQALMAYNLELDQALKSAQAEHAWFQANDKGAKVLIVNADNGETVKEYYAIPRNFLETLNA